MPACLCPAVMVQKVMHVSVENASFVPMKSKAVFLVFKPMEGEILSFTLTLGIIVNLLGLRESSMFCYPSITLYNLSS